MDKSALRQGTA